MINGEIIYRPENWLVVLSMLAIGTVAATIIDTFLVGYIETPNSEDQ